VRPNPRRFGSAVGSHTYAAYNYIIQEHTIEETVSATYYHHHHHTVPHSYFAPNTSTEHHLIFEPWLCGFPKAFFCTLYLIGCRRTALGADSDQDCRKDPSSGLANNPLVCRESPKNEFVGLCFNFDAVTWSIAHRIENDGMIEELCSDLEHLPHAKQGFEKVCTA
jgi:hypothetical protein